MCSFLEWIDKFFPPMASVSPVSKASPDLPKRPPATSLNVIGVFLRVGLLDRFASVIDNTNIPHTSRAKKNVFMILHTFLAQMVNENNSDQLSNVKVAFQRACPIGNNSDPGTCTNIIRAVVRNLLFQDSFELLFFGMQCLHFFDQLHEQAVLEMFRPEDNLLTQITSKGEPWLIGMSRLENEDIVACC